MWCDSFSESHCETNTQIVHSQQQILVFSDTFLFHSNSSYVHVWYHVAVEWIISHKVYRRKFYVYRLHFVWRLLLHSQIDEVVMQQFPLKNHFPSIIN